MRRLVIGIIAVVLLYFAVTTTLVAVWMGKDEHPKVDAIVVLGAAQYDGRPAASYAARLEHAVDLYHSGVAPLIVFTGGNEPGDRFTEGGSGARWAVQHGIPSGPPLVAETSRTTYENLKGAKRVLDVHLSSQHPKVVVVSDPFHMFRAMKQASDLSLVAYPHQPDQRQPCQPYRGRAPRGHRPRRLPHHPWPMSGSAVPMAQARFPWHRRSWEGSGGSELPPEWNGDPRRDHPTERFSNTQSQGGLLGRHRG